MWRPALSVMRWVPTGGLTDPGSASSIPQMRKNWGWSCLPAQSGSQGNRLATLTRVSNESSHPSHDAVVERAASFCRSRVVHPRAARLQERGRMVSIPLAVMSATAQRRQEGDRSEGESSVSDSDDDKPLRLQRDAARTTATPAQPVSLLPRDAVPTERVVSQLLRPRSPARAAALASDEPAERRGREGTEGKPVASTHRRDVSLARAAESIGRSKSDSLEWSPAGGSEANRMWEDARPGAVSDFAARVGWDINDAGETHVVDGEIIPDSQESDEEVAGERGARRASRLSGADYTAALALQWSSPVGEGELVPVRGNGVIPDSEDEEGL